MDCAGIGHRRFGSAVVRPVRFICTHRQSLRKAGPIYAAHAELGKFQAQINGALASQRTIVAERRDDLSYRANRIDLSKARFLRVLEVRLHPGHEGEFAEASKKLAAAYEKKGIRFAVGRVSGERGDVLANIFCVCADENSSAER